MDKHKRHKPFFILILGKRGSNVKVSSLPSHPRTCLLVRNPAHMGTAFRQPSWVQEPEGEEQGQHPEVPPARSLQEKAYVPESWKTQLSYKKGNTSLPGAWLAVDREQHSVKRPSCREKKAALSVHASWALPGPPGPTSRGALSLHNYRLHPQGTEDPGHPAGLPLYYSVAPMSLHLTCPPKLSILMVSQDSAFLRFWLGGRTIPESWTELLSRDPRQGSQRRQLGPLLLPGTQHGPDSDLRPGNLTPGSRKQRLQEPQGPAPGTRPWLQTTTLHRAHRGLRAWEELWDHNSQKASRPRRQTTASENYAS